MKKKRRLSHRYSYYIAIVLLIVFVLSVALLGVNLWEMKQGNYTEFQTSEQTVYYKEQEYCKKENVETFLVLGLDKNSEDTVVSSYNNDKQADFLMLFVFDHDAETCQVLQINRDTMAQIDVLGVAGNRVDTVEKQIALAHTYGNGDDLSCRNTAESVSRLLMGAKIDHYLSVTMDAVPLYNDLLGGVEVTVQDDFSGVDDTLVLGETVTLEGEHALNFVRTRYGLEDSSNSTRMKRQQQYVNALMEKTQQQMEQEPDFLLDAAVSLSGYTVSDRSVNQLQELAKKFNAYEVGDILNIPGESVMGEEHIEFYPDEDGLQELVLSLFYQEKS